ncbi:MAG: hypothetical protein ILO36_03800 [Abditibacteriota bacterium]|nr:hypothetical protein [Abditibacteriota bacterium]
MSELQLLELALKYRTDEEKEVLAMCSTLTGIEIDSLSSLSKALDTAVKCLRMLNTNKDKIKDLPAETYSRLGNIEFQLQILEGKIKRSAYLIENIGDIQKELTPREQEVLKNRFLGNRSRTETAELLNISEVRVRQLEVQVLEKLKKAKINKEI